MHFKYIQNVYFIGIGGIGMSALARYFHAGGQTVSGYDKTSGPMTDALKSEGIDIHFSDDVSLIPDQFIHPQDAKQHSLIVYTPAVPNDHSELTYFLNNGYTVKKRAEVLGMITENNFTIAVAGTHGKTTTSSIIAHLLKSSGIDCTAFLGGIAKNYNSNLVLGKRNTPMHVFVVEADEFDRSFLKLKPDIAVITSMDADHLDIYGDKKYLEDSYRLFANQLKDSGKLIYKYGLPLDDLQLNHAVYSLTGPADYSGSGIRIINHRYHFDWNDSNTMIQDLSSEMPGMHNVENAIAAIAVARELGIAPVKISAAMNSYTGVKRRFDYQVNSERIVYIDDYAHHPEELRACISSVRDLYPGKKLTGIFQPHLFTRTRDFAEGFAKSLSLLDSLILLDIYPARELPIKGVTSAMIFEQVSILDKVICKKEQVLDLMNDRTPEVLLTLGAGDIDELVEPLKKMIDNKIVHV